MPNLPSPLSSASSRYVPAAKYDASRVLMLEATSAAARFSASRKARAAAKRRWALRGNGFRCQLRGTLAADVFRLT